MNHQNLFFSSLNTKLIYSKTWRRFCLVKSLMVCQLQGDLSSGRGRVDRAPPGSPVFVGAYFRGAGVGRGFRFHLLRRMSQIRCLLGPRNTVTEGTKRHVARVTQEP